MNALKAHSEVLWRKALARGFAPDEIVAQSRLLQNAIYDHRRRSPLAFDWVYGLLRREDKELMNVGAEALVEEASTVRGYSASA